MGTLCVRALRVEPGGLSKCAKIGGMERRVDIENCK